MFWRGNSCVVAACQSALHFFFFLFLFGKTKSSHLIDSGVLLEKTRRDDKKNININMNQVIWSSKFCPADAHTMGYIFLNFFNARGNPHPDNYYTIHTHTHTHTAAIVVSIRQTKIKVGLKYNSPLVAVYLCGWSAGQQNKTKQNIKSKQKKNWKIGEEQNAHSSLPLSLYDYKFMGIF